MPKSQKVYCILLLYFLHKPFYGHRSSMKNITDNQILRNTIVSKNFPICKVPRRPVVVRMFRSIVPRKYFFEFWLG